MGTLVAVHNAGVPFLLTTKNSEIMAGKIGYSGSVYQKINREKLRRDIMTSTEEDRVLKDEIARIFQKANRRIQNIEEAELFSPAVEALGDMGSKYTKFSMAGSWTDLKMRYGQAIAFLREPTSTATGARQYNEHIRQAYELTEDEYKLMMDNFRGKILSVRDTDFVERYLMRYKDFTGELETAAADVSSQIEADAVQLENALQADLESSVDELLDRGIERMMDDLDPLLDELNSLGGSL